MGIPSDYVIADKGIDFQVVHFDWTLAGST